MLPRLCLLSFFIVALSNVYAQKKFTLEKDLRSEWLIFSDGAYQAAGDIGLSGLRTVYFRFNARSYPDCLLRLSSDANYFLFVNGKVVGEYQGQAILDVDSLARAVNSDALLLAIHQERINPRDLRTELISTHHPPVAVQGNALKPYFHLRDFVVIAGLLIMLLFVLEMRLNPKLARDYFAVGRILSSRDVDDSQASARLTSGANVQFYILCSLLIGFYLLIVFSNLPARYALPIAFRADGFWMNLWQWLKLSFLVFIFCMLKLLIIFSATRLFGMRGMARFHFFNWMRLSLLLFGTAVVVLFIYFISHGKNPEVFAIFLSVIVAAIVAWIAVAIFKLSGRTGHSLFHLFSYLCATEIIPLFITVKILFQ